MKAKKGVFLFICTLCIIVCSFSLVSAATISGSIYDFNLAKVRGAVIKVNTSPEQVVVSESGEYLLELDTGSYLIEVSKLERAGLIAIDSAVFNVQSDGTYTHDFILFEEALEVEIPDISDGEKGVGDLKFHPVLISIGVIIIIFLSLIAWRQQKKDELSPPSEEDEVLKELSFFIKKHKRVAQKDLRMHFPYSESAVSMAITHLESLGYVQKIKKGRSNVVVWLGKPKEEKKGK